MCKYAAVPLSISLLFFIGDVVLFAVPGAWLIQESAVWLFFILSLALVPILWLRHWFSGVSMIAGAIAVFFIIVNPTPAQSLSRKAADLVHVLVYRNALQRQVQEMQRQGISPTAAVIPIDGFGSVTDGIAFDPTGEILRPAGRRTKAWLAVADETDLGREGMDARHIVGNYHAWFHW